MKTRTLIRYLFFSSSYFAFFFSIFDTTRQKRSIGVYTKQMRHIFQCCVSPTVVHCIAFSMFSLFTFYSLDSFFFFFCTLLNPVRDDRNRIFTDKDRFLYSAKKILHVRLQRVFHFFKRKKNIRVIEALEIRFLVITWKFFTQKLKVILMV